MRWQYITDKIQAEGFFSVAIDRGKLESLLQERSAEGWELVSVLPNWGYRGIMSSYLLIFKRPL
jgi:Domain of unknown function (DUF4177)